MGYNDFQPLINSWMDAKSFKLNYVALKSYRVSDHYFNTNLRVI